MAYDAAKYDIAGSFSRGAEGSLKNKRAKQRIKRADQKIQEESDSLHSRRRVMQRDRGISGAPPIQFEKAADMRSPFERVKDWFTKRDQDKVTPDEPGVGGGSTNYADAYKMGNKQALADDQAKGAAAAMQSQEDAMLAQSYGEMETDVPQYANGGRAIPPTSPSVNSYADGGQVNEGVQHEESNPGVFTVGAQRGDVATPVTSGIPQMADGGMAAMLAGDVPRTAEQRLAQYEKARTARPGPSQALSPQQNLEARPGIRGATSRARGTIRTRAANMPTSKTGRVLRAGARGAVGGAAIGTMVSAHKSGTTGTEEYRERYGIPESPNDGWRRVVDDVGVRIKGAAEDLGNTLTGGVAGDIGAGMMAPDTAVPEQAGSGVEPVSEDEVVSQDAIAKGAGMAAEAEEANRPPGEIDFSKVDFKSGDFPSMTVKDWREYRHATAADLIGMGASYEDAHDQVTATQQKGFLNYMKQGQMHLAAGNAAAASSSLRMAFQYFPNGSDVKIGVHQDPNTGEPVLLGMGMNDETGEGVGQPMYMDYKKLGQMIDNFGNPAAFRMWTKDRVDERQNDEKLGIEQQRADQVGQYQRDLGTAALGRADAALKAAASSLSGIEDLETAQARIAEALSLADIDEDDHDKLQSAMAQIKQMNPNITYSEIYERVIGQYQADPEQLDEMFDAIGIR